MNRRIIFIILGALLLLALIGFLWFWFLGRPTPTNNGNLGSGGLRPTATSTGFGTGNSQTPYGYNPSTQFEGETNIQTPIPSSDGTYTGGGSSGGGVTSDTSNPDVTWLGGGDFTSFNPTPINQLNGANISGTPYITKPADNSDPGGLGLGGILAGAGISGAVACTPGLLGALGLEGITTGGAAATDVAIDAQVAVPGEFFVSDPGLKTQISLLAPWLKGNTAVAGSQAIKENFLDCIARTIARAAITQMTAATVDWINSGFNGKPAFVQDYQAFFTNVADKAAGDFINQSGLAFLCSPFQLQVRIAVAQSYASSRNGSANACTLTSAVGNVERFMNGDFSQGGWGGLISVMTVPTNNPFGGFQYAQVALNNHILASTQEAQSRISPGGFLSMQEEYGCQNRITKDPDGSVSVEKYGCQYRTTTPGVLIEDRARQVLNLPIDQNLLAKSFDEIVGALINQLVTKTLQNGFSNLSGQNGYANSIANPLDEQATAASQQLLTNLQGAVSLAQQYGATQQGSINDIQTAQAQLTNLQNCWSAKGQSAQADTAGSQAQALQSRVTIYNNNITRANAAITKVQQLQTSALAATSLAQVQAVANALLTAQSSGQLITSAEVTSAQQNRTTLQAEMAALNAQTSGKLNQCNAS